MVKRFALDGPAHELKIRCIHRDDKVEAMKVCVNCQRRLGPEHLLSEESQKMESARIAVGLQGVYFRYYSCPRCGHDHIFLETEQMPGENEEDFRARMAALAGAVQEVDSERTTVLVVEQGNR
jgi:hypothetical protein